MKSKSSNQNIPNFKSLKSKIDNTQQHFMSERCVENVHFYILQAKKWHFSVKSEF